MLGTSLRGIGDAARISLADGDEVLTYDAERPGVPTDLTDRVSVLPPEWRPEYLDGVDRIVTSPWFSPVKPPLSDALKRGVDIVTEAGFGLEHLDTPFVAVTGTNGKTTVTELTTNMLTASGLRTLAAGNIGTPVCGLMEIDVDILVLELSSYQLRFMGSGTPRAAALLNIAPDHLDWHGSFEAYVEAKARIFSNMEPDALLVFNADDPLVVEVVGAAQCRLKPCSGTRVPDGGNGVDGRRIVIGDDSFEAPTDDPSFLLDIVVAGTLAYVAGANVDGVAAAIGEFSPGPHRRQIVGTTDGITWVDDSKATNPHATAAAVRSHAPVILLAGGRNKGLDLATIGALDGVTQIVAFGECGAEIAGAATSRSIIVETLDDAVTAARAIARQGDTVLLSPGCTSFDEFSSYAQRGDVFQRLVKRSEGAAA